MADKNPQDDNKLIAAGKTFRRVEPDTVLRDNGRCLTRSSGQLVEVQVLSEVLGESSAPSQVMVEGVVAGAAHAVIVDEVVADEEVLLRPMPYEGSDRIALLDEENLSRGLTRFGVSPANLPVGPPSNANSGCVGARFGRNGIAGGSNSGSTSSSSPAPGALNSKPVSSSDNPPTRADALPPACRELG